MCHLNYCTSIIIKKTQFSFLYIQSCETRLISLGKTSKGVIRFFFLKMKITINKQLESNKNKEIRVGKH